MGTLDYNSTAESSKSSYYSNTYLSTSNSNSGSTSSAIMTSTSSSNSETDNSTTYTSDVSSTSSSSSSSSSVKSTSSGKSSSTSSGRSTTTLESTSSTNNSLSSGSTNTSYSTSSGNSSSIASNSSTVTTQTVTNIFSQIQTITIINASQVTTQTLPNSEVTTKTLSEQIVTLGVPIATVTSTFTGENQGTTLTTPLFLSSTTIYPNYSYEYTQFYIITADSDSNSQNKRKKRDKIEKKHFKYNNKKKRKNDHNNDNKSNNNHNFNINKRATTTTSVSTVMEVLQNVTTQPQTETITTDLAYYTSYLKDNVKAQNMVVISQFTNTQLKNHKNLGAIIGGTLGGVFGALFVSMVFLKWYIQRKSTSSSSSSKDISIGRTKSEIDGDEVDTINPVNDGFSHYSGRRVNLFEESDLLQYYATPSPSSNNPIIRLLEICHLKSKDGGSSKMVDPFNDEFDFKGRQELQPPVIVEKSARDIVNESNPFNDSNEISFMGAEYNGSGSAHSYDSENDRNIDLNERGSSGGMNSRSDRDDENNNNSSDDDDESVIIDTFSMSSLCPNTEIKENGMLLEII